MADSHGASERSGLTVAYRDGAGETAIQIPNGAGTRFLLTDGQQGYLALGSPNTSNYDGWYAVAPDGQPVKILADLAPAAAIDAIAIEDALVTRRAGAMHQEWRIDERGVRMRGKGSFTLTLDCKRRYDESDQGRIYASSDTGAPSQEGVRARSIARIVSGAVLYTKHNDGHISAENVAYRLHVGFATTFAMRRLDTWRMAQYPYDERRGTHGTPWVYDLASLGGEGEIAIAIGKDPKDARRRAIDLLLRPPKGRHCVVPPSVAACALPARLAWRSLCCLRTESGIIAGLPWFSQLWSRDELIACGALIGAGDAVSLGAATAIIDRWYGAVRPDGSLPAIFPDAGLRSADAPGWLGRRTLDLLAASPPAHQLPLERWRDAARSLVDGLSVRDDLVWTGHNETWMDTAGADDGRAGARIEIQALALALLGAHATLCERTGVGVPDKTRFLRQRISDAARVRLRDGEVLIDGLMQDGTADRTVRPNVFLAWRAWPDLVGTDVWRATFWKALDRLWLPWGGVASIDTADPRYRARDTGEDTAAYHRGDSWYFVNAIAAMGLRATDPDGSALAVRRLIAGIERDLLSQGSLGHISEISSAMDQEAMGCHAQAWSASCYIEAVLAGLRHA